MQPHARSMAGNVHASRSECDSKVLANSTGKVLMRNSCIVLEDITKKTGNFKRFSVFVEMLLSSLRKSSQIVQLDFLTSDDLESLKSTQRPRPEPVSQPSDRDKSWKKVYMILTYAVAFDRVHYPLPLLSEGQGVQGGQGGQGWILRDPEKDALAEENAELRTEKSKQLKEISALLRENDKLKYKLKHTKTPNHEARNATSSGPVKHAQRDLAKELNALRIGTQRFLKDIQHELSSFCRKHPAIQNKTICPVWRL
ncbi:hypothetical protein DFJ77DRAFT_166685 [Powellomyces hirtus]|nr:hypothetical protein DFJ77DRAFT_166685 [Powellomyces hirtus]